MVNSSVYSHERFQVLNVDSRAVGEVIFVDESYKYGILSHDCRLAVLHGVWQNVGLDKRNPGSSPVLLCCLLTDVI